MKFTINTKEFLKLLEKSLLKGKYITSGGMKSKALSDFVQLVAGDGLTVYNADDSTIVKIKYDCVIEEKGEIIVEVNMLIKYLKTMGEETNFYGKDTVKLTSNNKKAEIPIVVIHPHYSTISMMGNKDINFNLEMNDFIDYGSKNKQYTTALQLNSATLADAIKACELVQSGIYTLNYNEDFTISSNLGNESYSQQIDLLRHNGDPATISISAPVHSLFNNEIINIYMSDDVPITIVSESAFLVRAPRIGGD